jgi:23S rRNA (pseudouridine1915-N3)-methyltransferase
MFKIRIFSVGKTKETWLEEALQLYLKRLKPFCQIEFILAKDDRQLTALASKESHAICLDPSGSSFSSEEFSSFLVKKLEEGGSKVAFIIGGATGLSPELKEAFPLISFSRMTFTHQMMRLLLVEQIYRALEIAKGSSYHK